MPFKSRYVLIYYPPEVRRGKYCRLGEFCCNILPSCQDMKTIKLLLHKHEYSRIVKKKKKKKNLRGSSQATILPLAIILTTALWALVSIIASGVLRCLEGGAKSFVPTIFPFCSMPHPQPPPPPPQPEPLPVINDQSK